MATGSTLFPFAHWALSSLGVSPRVVSLNAMARRVVCALLRPREWNSRTGACLGSPPKRPTCVREEAISGGRRTAFSASMHAANNCKTPLGREGAGRCLPAGRLPNRGENPAKVQAARCLLRELRLRHYRQSARRLTSSSLK